jgi:hypothetical protein
MNPGNTRSRHWLPLLIASTVVIAPWSTYVAAQVPTSPPPQEMLPPPESATPSQAVDDKKLDQFAAAFIVVEGIQRDAIQRLQAETDQQKVSEVKAQAESDAIAAVEKTGLPLVEFNQIAELMMTDLALREKVAARITQRRPAASGAKAPNS